MSALESPPGQHHRDSRPADETAVEPGARRLGARHSARIRSLLLNIVSLLGLFVVWHIAALVWSSPFLPTPVRTLEAFVRVARDGDILGYSLWDHTKASTIRVLAGFAAGAMIGAPLGLFMGLFPKVWSAVRGALEPLRFIPPIAWIPLAIVLLVGLPRFAFLIFLGVFFPVFIGTAAAVARVESLHVEVAKVYGASRGWTTRHVVIPSVLPEIMTSMRVGLGIGWMTIVAAEMAGGTPEGLGKFMINYADLLRVPEIIVGMALIGILGFVLNELILIAERRLFKWRWAVSL